MMIGIGTPRSQSRIPRPITPSLRKIADINNRSPQLFRRSLRAGSPDAVCGLPADGWNRRMRETIRVSASPSEASLLRRVE
jgi:hypothetical protein